MKERYSTIEWCLRTMSYVLRMFICCFFCHGKATDCGGKDVAQTIIVTNNDRWVKIHIKPDLIIH
ncbi:unnamed protein product, partial [Sphenostylis stenocarpa]